MEKDWTVITGDCLAILPTLAAGSVQAVVTDPPYGIGFEGHGQLFRRSQQIAGDNNGFAAEQVRNWAHGRCLPCCCFFSPYLPVTGWRNVLVWSKGAHVGIGGDRETCWKRDFEMIGVEGNAALNGPRDSGVLRFNAVSPPPSGHVAEKPLALMTYLVGKLTRPGATVLDPFCGSGTTGVACRKLGRKFIGIEIDEGYATIARRRIADAGFPLLEQSP